jgi:hypothetical protein
LSRKQATRTKPDPNLEALGYIAEEDFARMLRVKPKTLLNRHDLPPRYKLGRLSVRKLDEVRAWIARRAVAK